MALGMGHERNGVSDMELAVSYVAAILTANDETTLGELILQVADDERIRYNGYVWKNIMAAINAMPQFPQFPAGGG